MRELLDSPSSGPGEPTRDLGGGLGSFSQPRQPAGLVQDLNSWALPAQQGKRVALGFAPTDSLLQQMSGEWFRPAYQGS